MLLRAVVTGLTAVVLLARVVMAADGDVVAKVNGEGIPRFALERGLRSAFLKRGILGTTAKKQGIYASLRDEVLNQLIDEELLYQAARGKGLAPDDKAVVERLGSIRASFPTPEGYRAYLGKSFASEETIAYFTGHQMALEALTERELARGGAVSDAEVHDYYTANVDRYSSPERVRARHVLIHAKPDAPPEVKDAAMTKIREVLRQAESGADFGALARTHSECPSAKKGGDLGFFARGQTAPPFEEAAFALKPGEISKVVATDFGYHVIKVEERLAASVKSEGDVAREIREQLGARKRRAAAQEFARQLRSTATIELLPIADP